MPDTTEERFWAKVKKTDGCWIWTGGRIRNGYGSMRAWGRTVLAHHVSWALHYGPHHRSLQVLHECDVRACVRPDHLFLGTNADNVADRVAKGRSRAALSRDDIAAVRELAADGSYSQREIAAMFGVSQATISNLHRRLHHNY